MLHGRNLRIHESRILGEAAGRPGEIVPGDLFAVCCGDNTALELITVQYDGGKKLGAKSFLNGHKIAANTVLGK